MRALFILTLIACSSATGSGTFKNDIFADCKITHSAIKNAAETIKAQINDLGEWGLENKKDADEFEKKLGVYVELRDELFEDIITADLRLLGLCALISEFSKSEHTLEKKTILYSYAMQSIFSKQKSALREIVLSRATIGKHGWDISKNDFKVLTQVQLQVSESLEQEIRLYYSLRQLFTDENWNDFSQSL